MSAKKKIALQQVQLWLGIFAITQIFRNDMLRKT